MAVEIKELVIRAVIDYQTTSKEAPTNNNNHQPLTADQAIIVDACVKKVLQIINRTNKR